MDVLQAPDISDSSESTALTSNLSSSKHSDKSEDLKDPEEQPGKRLKQCIESGDTEETEGRILPKVPSFNDDSSRDGVSTELSFSLCPPAHELPLRPLPAIEANFVQYYVIDFLKPGHDQYIYRHANGLCVIGLASTHVALADDAEVKAVDYNVGKSNRSDIHVTGKRKKNAHHLEANSALCKVVSKDTYYIIRCCVKGSLLEVNERLIKQPQLLKRSASTEGYVAIMMPRPEDWNKSKNSLISQEEYKRKRGLC